MSAKSLSGWVKAEREEMPELPLLKQLREAGLTHLVKTLNGCGEYEKKWRCDCGESYSVKRYCHHHLCTACKRRKSYTLSLEVEAVLIALRVTYPGLKVFNVTLTLPACASDKLSEQLKALNAGFSKLMHQVQIKKHCIGAIKATEVSFNREKGTYHAHVHSLIVMKASYISKGYLSNDDWLKLWRRVTKCQHVTHIHVKPVKAGSTNSLTLEKITSSLFAYAMKPSLPDKWTPRSLVALSQALHKKRTCEFFGELRKIRKHVKEGSPLCRHHPISSNQPSEFAIDEK